MGHNCFVCSVSVDEILIEVFHMKDHSFGFIGDWCNKKRKGFSGIGDNGFKHFNGVNWSVGRVNYCSVSGKATRMVVGS